MAATAEQLSRAAWSRLLWWRFRLFQRHRHDRLVLEEVAGRPILVLPRVINPKLFRTGEFLAQTIDGRIARGATVLDMGTGAGIGAIVAAGCGARVKAVDVNPVAVRCARINALLNGVEDRVEVVLFNPPYLPGPPRDLLDRAFRGGDVIDRFARGLAQHLAPAGFALVLLSTEADADSALASFASSALSMTPVSERNLKNEVLTVYRVCAESIEPRVQG
jgi:methylase of polypeptide subunit release factors